MDFDGDRRRLCDPRISVRDPADYPFCWRLVLRLVSLARPGVRELVVTALVAKDPRLFLASHATDHRHGPVGLRYDDIADKEFLPRGNSQAICADRTRQGLHQ